MERVGTLLQKLQEQFASHAPAEQLLLTVQQLNAELLHLQKETISNKMVSVDIATMIHQPPQNAVAPEPVPAPAQPEEKIVEVLQIDEAEVEAELEEIKRKSEELQRMSVHNKPAVVFDTDEEIPTLAHQQNNNNNKPAAKEINEAAAEQHLSLNDKLKQGTMELGDQLVEAPIRDLRKAIGVNDRFLYIKELFRGDEAMYERSIKTINGFSILPEAEYWIQRELKVKLGWNDSSEVLKQFNQLVKRRFT